VVLLVVDIFMPKDFKEGSTDEEGHGSIDPLCHGATRVLHLESIEEVEWCEGYHFWRGE
jgi:hypothetical protein